MRQRISKKLDALAGFRYGPDIASNNLDVHLQGALT